MRRSKNNKNEISPAFEKAVKIGLTVLFLWVIIASCLASPIAAANAQSASGSGSSDGLISGPVIGIDLGTTYSCVAHHSNGQTIVIPNEQGNRITPSIVSFKEKERLIGDAAKNVMSSNPLNTVFGVKRLIGRMYEDKQVSNDQKLWPFKVVKDIESGKPMIEVEYKGQVKRYYAEEISAMVLSKMKKIAEDYLGEEVSNAVITVPAYFNDQQRQATKDAGIIAGLNVLRLINEPTAAAMAYGLGNAKQIASKDHMNIVVYDLGGGTFDVTLMELDSSGVFEVLSTSGDTHLGGEDFDNRVIQFYIKKIQKKHKINIRGNERALSKLRREVEKAKRTLSSANQVKIEIDNLVKGVDFEDTLSRAKFESINNDLFKKTLKPLEQVLKETQLKKSEVDEIVLVGGSTRIPKIQEMVSKYFNGKQVNRGINEDEAVAYGAAIQAAILKGDTNDLGSLPTVMDATPLSLGIETVGGIMTRIIEKNSIIPNSKSQIFSTYVDNQPAVTIKVYQGERAQTKDNILLGEFNLNGIPAARKGEPQIEVTFNVDVNGILNVNAKDKNNPGNEESIAIEKHTGGLSEKDIQEALEEAMQFEKEDEAIREMIGIKTNLESKAYRIKQQLEDEEEMVIDDETEKEVLSEACNDLLEWLEENDSELNDIDFLEDIKEKQSEFDEIVNPILAKYSSSSGGAGYGGSSAYGQEDEEEDSYYDREL